MTLLVFLASTIAVLPADRMAMADRLFNKGKYAEAVTEYRDLKAKGGVAADEIIFRIAECDRALGDEKAAHEGYQKVYSAHPDSKHAVRSRFLYALGCEPAERKRLLAGLDADGVDLDTRTAALYHLGGETGDIAMLERCAKLNPQGRYAAYAELKRGNLLCADKDAVVRRKGVEVLLGVAFGKSALAADALYLAAMQSYRDRKYGEAASLLRRYRKRAPTGTNIGEVNSMLAWCDYLEGRYAEALSTANEAESDDLSYLRAAARYAMGEDVKAMELFREYLENYPRGRYRKECELPMARMAFDSSLKTNDMATAVASAKRGFALSGLATDELRLAWAYEKAGKIDFAREEYQKIAASFVGSAESAEAMYRRAMIEARADRWSAAELALAEALSTGKLGERRANALYWRGVAAMRIDHKKEGAEFLAEALKLGLSLDDGREARLMIADYDFAAGRVKEAREAYVKLVSEGACERMSAAHILAVGKLIGGDGANICAKALVAQNSLEWRQAGYALMGAVEEGRGAFAAAIAAYRKCMAEKTATEEVAAASLSLGKLEFRGGEYAAAETTLKEAIKLNAANANARAEAYLTLAKNVGAKGDWKAALAYATVVTALFEATPFCEEARAIIAAHPEVKEEK